MKLDENPKGMALIMLAIGIFGIGVILVLGFYGNTELLGIGITMAVIGGAGSILGCIHMGSVQRKKNIKEDTIAPPRIPPPTEIIFQDSVMPPQEELEYDRFSASPPRNPDYSPAQGGGPKMIDPSWLHNDGRGGSTLQAPRFAAVNTYNVREGGSAGVLGGGVGGLSPRRTGSVLPNGGQGQGGGGPPLVGPLSPYEQRSFPVPQAIPMGGGGGSQQHSPSRPLPHGNGDALSFNNRSSVVNNNGGGGYTPRSSVFGNGNNNRSSVYRQHGGDTSMVSDDGYSPGVHSRMNASTDSNRMPTHNSSHHQQDPYLYPGQQQQSTPNRNTSYVGGGRGGSLGVQDRDGAGAAVDAYTNSPGGGGGGQHGGDDDALPQHYWSPS